MLESTTKYALKALLFLASKPDDRYVRVEEISAEAGAPGPYLSKIMKTLAIKGLVLAKRGSMGGVKLAPRIQEITFYDVCVALDDPIVGVGCMLGNGLCNKNNPCQFHHQWTKMKQEVAQHFSQFKISAHPLLSNRDK